MARLSYSPPFMLPYIRLLVPGLALVAFGTTLGSSFHFDDYSLFVDPAVTSPAGWWQVFRIEQTRPLTYLTFWLNYQLGGQEPFGYHAVNLILHLVSCWMALSIFRRVLPSEPAAAWAAVIFALHPLQTEAVAYVFARATLLSALLCLVCWKFWLDGRRGLAVLSFAAALLAKEEAAAFPLFLLGWEWLFGDAGRRKWRRVFGTVAAMLGLVALAALRLFYAAMVTPESGFAFGLGEVTSSNYLLTQARSFWEYARLVFIPVGFNFDRDFALSTGFDANTLLAWLALLAAFVTTLWWIRKERHFFWFLGGLLLLAPTSSIAPLADLAVERRMYLPLVSFGPFLGYWLDRAFNHAPAAARQFALIGLAVALAACSFARSRVWQSEESLWRDTVEKSPAKVRPKLQLARALGEHGPQAVPERIELLRQARELSPGSPDAALEFGVLHLQTGSPAEALTAFDSAAAIEPGNAQIEANRGAALYLLGRLPEAESALSSALEKDPCNFDARNNLILLYRSLGDAGAVRRTAEVPPDCRWALERRQMMDAARN